MASDLFEFDGSFFSDPFFSDSITMDNILQSIPENPSKEILNEEIDKFASSVLSSSSSTYQMENLSLSQTPPMENASNFPSLDVKTEESHIPFSSAPVSINNSFVPTYGGSENGVKLMQRSYSSNDFGGKPSFLFQPSSMESPNFPTRKVSSLPENSSSYTKMRRVCSAGDLQSVEKSKRLTSTPLATESTFMEEASRATRYSPEERKESIQRYREKRSHRNFSKKIKYACRKTLADNRLRIRGRFARNDEVGDVPQPATFNQHEDHHHLRIEGSHERGAGNRAQGRGLAFCNSYACAPTHIPYYYAINN